jgi:bifunctional pyridoxal-dependent enzyme with beta-cystathionase and maltose regulon repressor activities
MAERNLDFDKITDRRNTNCLKYDFAVKRGMPEDVLPLWVADMDFQTSSYVQDALIKQVQHGIFGYSDGQESYFEAVKGWLKKHHDWEVQENWLVKTPGIVMALALSALTMTDPAGGTSSANRRKRDGAGVVRKSIYRSGRCSIDSVTGILSFFRSDFR